MRLALLYAHAIDSRRPEIFDAIFTPDAVVDVAGRLREGLPALHAMLAWASEKWLSTLHKVHNQLLLHGRTPGTRPRRRHDAVQHVDPLRR